MNSQCSDAVLRVQSVPSFDTISFSKPSKVSISSERTREMPRAREQKRGLRVRPRHGEAKRSTWPRPEILSKAPGMDVLCRRIRHAPLACTSGGTRWHQNSLKAYDCSCKDFNLPCHFVPSVQVSFQWRGRSLPEQVGCSSLPGIYGSTVQVTTQSCRFSPSTPKTELQAPSKELSLPNKFAFAHTPPCIYLHSTLGWFQLLIWRGVYNLYVCTSP